ncbi:MAG: class I SAM-dependent RNA methyltransferase [Deltaproteobacteria bacterium]|nr:class I SAM-dependent RNA methyltransferase [Deltaproteobacteria bacterium]
MPPLIEITSLAYGGAGIGRLDGKVTFVPYTAPGDIALVKITGGKNNFNYAELVELKTPSALRVSPACPVFMRCGGCQWQHIGYPHQVEWKHEIFAETLKRIAGVKPSGNLKEPIPSPKPFNYRSRARFHTDGKKWGFFEVKSHDIVDIAECPLLEPLINSTFRDIKNAGQPEALHSVDIALDTKNSKTVAAFYLREPAPIGLAGALKKVVEKGDLKGYEVYLKKPFKRGRGERIESRGDTTVGYDAFGATISSGITVFSQSNLFQNEGIIKTALEFAGLEGKEDILDLYCGAGNLTIPLAKRAGKAIGIDSDEEAIASARLNAKANSCGAIEFIAESALRSKILERYAPRVVVLDPPRGGGPDVIRKIAASGVKKIVYVSCSPPTMARDIAVLIKNGYRLSVAVCVDMFPQTYHIEAVAGLAL